jgi:hypothetical protein
MELDWQNQKLQEVIPYFILEDYPKPIAKYKLGNIFSNEIEAKNVLSNRRSTNDLLEELSNYYYKKHNQPKKLIIYDKLIPMVYNKVYERPKEKSEKTTLENLNESQYMDIKDCNIKLYTDKVVLSTDENIKEFRRLMSDGNFFKIFDNMTEVPNFRTGPQGDKFDSFLGFFINKIIPEQTCHNFTYNEVSFYSPSDISQVKYYRYNLNMINEFKECNQIYYIHTQIVTFRNNKSGRHVNSLIIDKKLKQITIFESGGIEYLKYENYYQFLQQALGLDIREYKFNLPIDCPNMRVQGIYKSVHGQKDVFCVMWSAYFTLMKFINREKSYEEIIKIITSPSRNPFNDMLKLQYLIEINFLSVSKKYIFDIQYCWIQPTFRLYHKEKEDNTVKYGLPYHF